MKKSYETPLIEVIKLEEDIITISGEHQTLREQEGSTGGVNFGDLFGGNN